jgi:Asp-tRNA(Asn)/Glu-tRNA(Gln) amidotransferase A subunit family amidase
MSYQTIAAVQSAIVSKEVSARELAEASLARIKAVDGQLGGFLRTRDQVLAEADAADARIAQGDILPLDGVTVAVKDNMGIRGEEVTAASKILAGYSAVTTAAMLRGTEKP